MDHEQFLTMVAQIAHTDRDTAERASQFVLTVHNPAPATVTTAVMGLRWSPPI